MVKNQKVQCDYKQVLIDNFEVNGIGIKVYLKALKKSVKQYCKDTGLEYKIGMKQFYKQL